MLVRASSFPCQIVSHNLYRFQYTLCDLVLFFQIYYYRLYNSRRRAGLGDAGETSPLLVENANGASDTKPSPRSPSLLRDTIKYMLLSLFVVSFGVGAFFYDKRFGKDTDSSDPLPPRDKFEWKSQVMGYASALLYLGSRIPQIST